MITQTEIANKRLIENGTATMAEIIQEYIEYHDTSEMQKGVDYYDNENEILNREIKYYKDGKLVVDDTAVNNKLNHHFHGLLVDQKANYLVGKPMTFSATNTSEEDEPATDEEEFVEFINDLLGDDFNDDIWELVKDSANKGVEWLHPYIKSGGAFEYVRIDARQFIPIWETRMQKELAAGIRYYLLNVNGEDRIKAEYWTREKVSHYIEGDNGVLQLEKEESHFDYNEEPRSWGKVPFIPFKNNEKMTSDLKKYKKLIDNYDLNTSDLANNLEEIQEAIWILQNYAGESLEEFQENLRKYKALKVDNDGGAKTETVNIPVEAKEKHLNRLEDDIFTFGQGVNPKTDKFGENPSGVALKFLYALLDLKADKTERKFKRAIREFLWYIAEYLKYAEKTEYDYKAVD
ncbi:MAG: phage portal protein, partial [Halanaerobiales bacterium]